MAIYKAKKPTGWIVHPGNDTIKAGEIRVKVRRPSRADREIFASSLAEYDKFQPAINPDTQKPFLDATGAVRALKIPRRYPLEPSLKYLQKFVEEITGFEDEHGAIQFTDALAPGMLAELMEERFDVKLMRPMPVLNDNGDETGKTEEKEIETSFLQVVLEGLNSGETYGDPLDSPAKTSSSDSSNVS